jgi:hypothetical protein
MPLSRSKINKVIITTIILSLNLTSTVFAASSYTTRAPFVSEGCCLKSFDTLGNSILTPEASIDSEPVMIDSAPCMVYYNDRDEFDAYCPDLPVEDFEEAQIADNMVATFQAPLDKDTDNTYFNPGDILHGIAIQDSPPLTTDGMAILGKGNVGLPSKSVGANYFADSTDIIFSAGVHVVGLDLFILTGNENVLITIYDVDGIVIDTTIVAATITGVFWGVCSNEPIGRLNLEGLNSGAEVVDNITFGKCSHAVGGELLELSTVRSYIVPLLVLFSVAILLKDNYSFRTTKSRFLDVFRRCVINS